MRQARCHEQNARRLRRRVARRRASRVLPEVSALLRGARELMTQRAHGPGVGATRVMMSHQNRRAPAGGSSTSCSDMSRTCPTMGRTGMGKMGNNSWGTRFKGSESHTRNCTQVCVTKQNSAGYHKAPPPPNIFVHLLGRKRPGPLNDLIFSVDRLRKTYDATNPVRALAEWRRAAEARAGLPIRPLEGVHW